MSTIALYSNKVNQMPGLIKDVKKAVTDYKSELSALKTKTLTINKSVCNLDDVISSIQTSTKTQEDKITSLDTLSQNMENFASDTASIDGKVADTVKKRKDNFYDKYSYLKPECEKSGWEKIKDGCKKIGEWCKEHWVMIVTIIVVIVIAVVAAVCGVAIAVIAAIAGIVSLILTIADVICMLVTGGKGIADVLRENGFNVLADIFQGVSLGADIVSIVFPLGAAVKTIAKVGVKTFAKASISAAKVAFKETIEKVFKSGFKNGIKNLGKILFKTLIFDIDDFTRMENGKRILELWEPSLEMKDVGKGWIKSGDSLMPDPNYKPKPGQGNYRNTKNQTLDKILSDYGLDSIPLDKKGNVDWSKISIGDVDISMKNLDLDIDKVLSGEIDSTDLSKQLRKINFNNSDKQLKLNFDNSLADYATKGDYEKALGYKLTWHEDLSTKKCWLIPSEIHANIGHTGGIGNYKFNLNQISNISNLIGEKSTQWGFRFGID